jgi:hypothetical protein
MGGTGGAFPGGNTSAVTPLGRGPVPGLTQPGQIGGGAANPNSNPFMTQPYNPAQPPPPGGIAPPPGAGSSLAPPPQSYGQPGRPLPQGTFTPGVPPGPAVAPHPTETKTTTVQKPAGIAPSGAGATKSPGAGSPMSVAPMTATIPGNVKPLVTGMPTAGPQPPVPGTMQGFMQGFMGGPPLRRGPQPGAPSITNPQIAPPVPGMVKPGIGQRVGGATAGGGK